jgi:hypothetical protein
LALAAAIAPAHWRARNQMLPSIRPGVSISTLLEVVAQKAYQEGFLAFLDRWSNSIQNRRLAIVPDNLNTHTNEAARKWLKSRSLVSFHFTRDPRFMGKPH